ncbi:hypothetical protein [Vibrio vulnificus]|uniref:hypothetical protein n=1 Tax=Vibrio vulnificus TaxID=672 RepID=UPI0040590372|nr:hypothetical protein [Vibrio vulnificus]
MNDQVLEEIRDSLNEIKALATPVMVVTHEFTPEQERQLRESLGKHKFVDIRPFEVSQIKTCLRPEPRDIHDIVHAINVLAMTNTDVLHVFVRFSGHVNELHVRACAIESEYIGSRPEYFFNESVYLEKEDALELLLLIESQLTELIIEAREAAETKTKEHHPKHCCHGVILYGKCKKCADASEGGEA